MNNNIDFYYFSGTGNTMLVARKMTDTFIENGCHVNLKRMELSNGSDIDIENTIGLGFPVAILSTYTLVWEFINSLPNVQGTEIFMVDTLGGYSGGLVGPLRNILEKKGYKPIGACEILMPINIFFIQDKKTNDLKIRKGLEKAEKYAEALIEGTTNWGRVPFFSDIMYLISIGGFKLSAIDLHQKYFKFKTDKSKCNNCGICINICPLNNIVLDKYPVTQNKCEYCMRCVSMCPRHAIKSILTYKGNTYSAVKANDFVKNKTDSI